MTELRMVPAGEGEVVGDSPERRVELLCEDDALHATRSRFAAGRDGAGPHFHREHSDLFYVLEGELTVILGVDGERAVVPAGSLARVPPLVVHGFRNAGDEEVRYLNFHAPGGGFADFMRGLRDGTGVGFDSYDPPADGGRPTGEAKIGPGKVVAEEQGRRETLLCEIEAIAVTETRCEPGVSPSADLGGNHLASYYVLEGEIGLALGDGELRAAAGTWVQVPPGLSHTISVPGSSGARLLSVQTPGSDQAA
jgi:mannose-6-phosphate isomerase-like protein (cupin superfamily)